MHKINKHLSLVRALLMYGKDDDDRVSHVQFYIKKMTCISNNCQFYYIGLDKI